MLDTSTTASPQLGDDAIYKLPKVTTSERFHRPSIDDLVLLTLMETAQA